MPDDKYYNKVVWDNQTLIDLTSDTVTAGDLRSGVTAHGANGQQIVGTASFSQVQVDWDQTDTTAVDYIKNKPSIINTAKLLGNWFKPEGGYDANKRPTSANIHSGDTAGVKTFLATSSMTTGKPAQDGNILHFEWDNGARYSTQLAMLHGQAPQYRYQTGAGDTAADWSSWYSFFTEQNLPTKVKGIYTNNGGIQPPNYFGTNAVGFLMSNVSVNSDSHYKNIMYMDCYHGIDAGGVTALALDRTEARAFILQSNANRTSWTNTAEIITTNDVAEAATGSKLVKRTTSGYVKATYFNASCDDESGQFSVSSKMIFANSDGYFRKVSFSNFFGTLRSLVMVPRTSGTIVSSDNRVIIDEGSYYVISTGVPSGSTTIAICVLTMRVHASADTSTRIYFCNQMPKPIAPVGIIPTSYTTGKTANAAWYYIGTNGEGISNTGTIYKNEPHCINVAYVTALY